MRLARPLATPRLRLREFTAGDLPALIALAREADICATWGWDLPVEKDAGEFLAAALAAQEAPDRARYDFAITLGEAGPVIGDCELGRTPGGTDAEIGFCIAAAHRRRGLGTEAARALIAFGLSLPGIDRVVGLCAQGNEPSFGTMARAGMLVETQGQFRNEQTGLSVNAWLMAARKEAWAA